MYLKSCDVKEEDFCQINEHTNECGPKLFATIIFIFIFIILVLILRSSRGASPATTLCCDGKKMERTDGTEGRDEWETWECNNFTPPRIYFRATHVSIAYRSRGISNNFPIEADPHLSLQFAWVWPWLGGWWLQEVRDYWIWNPIILFVEWVNEWVVCSSAVHVFVSFFRFLLSNTSNRNTASVLDSRVGDIRTSIWMYRIFLLIGRRRIFFV